MRELQILAYIIALTPLISFLLLALTGKKMKPFITGLIGTTSLAIVCASSLIIAFLYFNNDGALKTAELVKYNWLPFTKDLSIELGFILDPISSMMLVVISIVSLMVHVFSMQYMKGEERFSTYYSYLSLFSFSMIGLVLSINIFQMYIFWELVGVSSYLLIGFYFQRPSAISAAKKAFIVTRFADLGFLIGILILGFGVGSFNIQTILTKVISNDTNVVQFAGLSFLGISAASWALALIFIGGAGKSAMFPLHIWLPDAMEGPTPVSALIHAATMVVAGVYLVARLFPVYSILAPGVLEGIAYVGVISAFLAAMIATTQNDLKRVLAYSTISQIGYMMFALGVARYNIESNEGFTASMFHLFTHAFFKASLFLSAGIIIHAVHNNDITQMGGLRKALPITHIVFLLACLAISGIPPFSGFFSKETILTSAHHHNQFVYYLALVTSGITAFYMFRLYFRVFWFKKPEDVHNHEHHMAAMTVPIIILAIGTIFSGFIPFGKFVHTAGSEPESAIHLSMVIAPISLSIIAILLAALLYMKESSRADSVVSKLKFIYKWLFNKLYFDEVYIFITKKIIFNLLGHFSSWFDRTIVNGFIDSMAWISEKTSEKIKFIQSGNVQTYAMYFLGGLITLILILIYL